MRFGIFYEHQLPRPWDERSEADLLREALVRELDLGHGVGSAARPGRG